MSVVSQSKEFFDENGIKYSEKNVQPDKKYQAKLLEKSGQLGVPVITVGEEEVVIGFNKERLKEDAWSIILWPIRLLRQKNKS